MRFIFKASLAAIAGLALAVPSVHATLPGANGRIVFVETPATGGAVSTINADGTNRTTVLEKFFSNGVHPVFSPDRQRIAAWFDGDIFLMDPDGANLWNVTHSPKSDEWPSWSPDGTRIALETQISTTQTKIALMSIYGQDRVELTDGYEPGWSPDGTQIAYWTASSPNDPNNFDIYKINIDGTGKTRLTETPGPSLRQETSPDWSPDGTRLAYQYNGQVWVMNADGTGEQQVTTGSPPDGGGLNPSWSPDGTRIAFERATLNETICSPGNCFTRTFWDVMTMNTDGSDIQNVTNTIDGMSEVDPSWESIRPPEPPGYPRPKGATPVRLSLVQAAASCTSPNRQHGPPLSFGSCSPPQPASGTLTVGTPDVTGTAAESVGSLRMEAVPGDPSTQTSEADVVLRLAITDVRRRSDLADYAGELGISAPLRLTDRHNSTGFTSSTAGTVRDTSFRATVQCAPTVDTGIGASCSLTTTAAALLPGGVPEGGRSTWQLGEVTVWDGGNDGDADTEPNTLFARPGVFVP
jgi:hypothetical protein